MRRAPLDQIRVDSPAASLEMIRRVFAGARGAGRDIVMLNAGAAIYVAGLANDLAGGVARAGEILDQGLASACFDQLVEVSRSLAAAE